MKWCVAVMLSGIAVLPATAGAQPQTPWARPTTGATQPPPSWTVAGGPALLAGGPLAAHVRIGSEWVPDWGLGFGLDGGWLCPVENPLVGVGTVSPTVVYSLGRDRRTAVSLRAGYTLLFLQGVGHATHVGVAFDRRLGRGGRLRLELRDTVLNLGERSFHVPEVTLGWVTP